VDAIELRLDVGEKTGQVGALLVRPDRPRALLVLAHGAGAGMRHPFMQAVSERLASRGIGTLRYQFPYMEKGSRRPDFKPVLFATVRAAVEEGSRHAEGIPLLAGGKSMGGRMTSLAASAKPLAGVRGLVFFGFPLHPAGRPSTERGDHLSGVTVPMLFLQGTRDTLAEPKLIERTVRGLAGPRLHVVDGADHSFHVLKSSGRTDDLVLEEIVDAVSDFLRDRCS
jgi:hypothetical protein